MPKEEPHLKDIRKQRMEKRKKRITTQPATVYWQVLGSGAYGAPTSLYLHTDHRRYLFNCGEGTQRLTSQLSLNKALAQLEHVFITSKSWKNIGGLPGLCLSVRSAGAPDITIHGPKGCMDLYEATKGFVTLFDFDVEAHTAEDGVFEDGGMRVETIVLKREGGGQECPPLSEDWAEDDQGINQDKTYDSDVQAYICQFSPRPGKLDIDKCIKMGLKPGPLLGQLKNGQDVTLDDGTVVKSSDVLGDSSPPSAFLVLDLPDLNYCHNLEKIQALHKIPRLDTVFHFSPLSVFQDERYRKFMNSLDKNVRHVFLNETCRGLGLSDVTAHAARLNTIRSDLFPQLQGSDDCISQNDLKSRMKKDREELGENVLRAVTGMRVNVRPHNQDRAVLDPNEVILFQQDAAVNELLLGNLQFPEDKQDYINAMAEALNYASRYKPTVIDDNSSCDTLNEYPKVTFLGTGSSVPSKYRNVSCILVETAPDNFILMDCGEGSFGQMVRLFGRDKTEHILRNLKCVYISHMHADHHLGLINIIQKRERLVNNGGEEKMFIVSTDRILPYLTYYHNKFESILTQVEFVKCERLILYSERDDETLEENDQKKIQKLYPDTLSRFFGHVGLSEFYTSRAIHCPNAFCLAFRTKDGYKISYSGDTRPCEKFREISTWGGPPDLLIHEATMEHFMIYDAKIKKHTTFTEAIEEGKLMKAKMTLLTHFSQRYAKMPYLAEIEDQPNVGVVFDNMTISRDKQNIIPSVYPALKRFFAEYLLELEERGDQYKAKYEPEANHGVGTGIDEDSPFMTKKQLAEKLEKRHEDKHQWFINVKKRKLLEKEQMAKKEKDRQEKFDRIERERAIAEKGRVEKFRKEHLRRKLADEQKRIDASKFVRNIRERSGVPLYKRKQEEWRLKENNELIQNNKKVMKRKERMQPLNHGDLDKFEKTYLRRKRQVKQLNYEYQRFVEENSPQKRRSRKPVFEREVMRTEDEKRRKQLENLKKKKQYSDIVRENFLPIPNIKKHKELVERRKKIRTLPKKPLRKAPDYLRGLKDRKDNIVRRTNIKRTIDSARNLIRQIDSERSHRPAKDTSKKRLVSSESEIYRQRRSARRRQEEERKKQASMKEKRRKRGKRISPLKKRLLHNNCAEDQTKKEAKVTVRASSEVNLKSPVQKPSTKVGKNEEEILERIHYLKSLDTDHAEISDCYINLIKTRLEKLKRTTMD